LNSPDLSPEDRRICERLVLKRGKDLERKIKSREVKKLMDEDKARRFTVSEQFPNLLCGLEFRIPNSFTS